jgi:hypothetical protein
MVLLCLPSLKRLHALCKHNNQLGLSLHQMAMPRFANTTVPAVEQLDHARAKEVTSVED